MTDGPIPNKVHYRIGEISRHTGLKPHVLRYWETEFPQIKPDKSRKGQRRYKRRDLAMIMEVKRLLYDEKFTIAGAKKALKNYQPDEQPATVGKNDPARAVKSVIEELKVIREILRE